MGQKVEVDGISNWKNWSRMCGDGEVLRQSTSFCDIRKFESFATLLGHIFRKVHRHCERGVLGPNQIEIAGDSTIQRVHMISEKQWKLFLQRTSQGCFLFGDFYLIRFGTLPGNAYQILGSWLNDNPVDPTLFSQDSIIRCCPSHDSGPKKHRMASIARTAGASRGDRCNSTTGFAKGFAKGFV